SPPPRRRRTATARSRTAAMACVERSPRHRHTTSQNVRRARRLAYVFQVSRRVPFSFELYPPRTPSNEQALRETVLRLAASGPDFLSVTFGAGGSTGGRSLEVLRFIREHTDVEPLAHLTCVGNTYEGAGRLIREFLDAGIRIFLALRGDPPAGQDPPLLGDLESAAQLVQLIDR